MAGHARTQIEARLDKAAARHPQVCHRVHAGEHVHVQQHAQPDAAQSLIRSVSRSTALLSLELAVLMAALIRITQHGRHHRRLLQPRQVGRSDARSGRLVSLVSPAIFGGTEVC
jgi:hypothetical protein